MQSTAFTIHDMINVVKKGMQDKQLSDLLKVMRILVGSHRGRDRNETSLNLHHLTAEEVKALMAEILLDKNIPTIHQVREVSILFHLHYLIFSNISQGCN